MKFVLILVLVAVARSRSHQSESERIRLANDNHQLLKNLFRQFAKEHRRDYASTFEGRIRLGIFRRFVKEAARINAEHSDLQVGITFFADLTEGEKQAYRGANITSGADTPEFRAPEGGLASTVSHKARYGPVKQQGNCGSCWAFGAVGTVEGHQALATRRYTALSEQQVLDCSGAGGCISGYHSGALSYLRGAGGLAASRDYPYQAQQGRCRDRASALSVGITGVSRPRGDHNLAGAISRGPVSVLLYNFHGVAIEGYKGGVIRPAHHGPWAQSHVVVALGYTSSTWELRNSWGTNWGSAGYFWHSRSVNNNMGISNHAYTITVQRTGQEEE